MTPDPQRRGEFPFPLSEGAGESHNLVWLRNHSNYMVVHGLADYMRGVGILVRGVIINSLIFLPYLLAASVLVSLAIVTDFPPPFIVTKGLVVVFVLWILLFSIGIPLLRVWRYRQTRQTGSDSTVEQRDRYERTFGGLLLGILAFGAIESLPTLVDLYRGELGTPTLAGFAAVMTGLLGIYPKLLSMLGAGVARAIALVAVGALGVALPLLLVILVSDFLVFGPPVDLTILNRLGGLPFPALVLLAVAIGWCQDAFKRKEAKSVALLIAASLAMVVLVFAFDDYVKTQHVDRNRVLADGAIAALAEDETEAPALAKALEARPTPEFEQLHGNLNQELEARTTPAHPDPRLEGLAKIGDRAGQYPEFGHVVAAIEDTGCDTGGADSIDCDALWREVEQLGTNLRTLASLFEADTRPALARLLIDLERSEIGALTLTAAHYPVIDSLADQPCPQEDETDSLSATSADEKRPETCFQETMRILPLYMVNVDEARAEIASHMSLTHFDPESALHATEAVRSFRMNAFVPKTFFVAIVALQLLWFCWLTVDVNLTSIHGLYRDRLVQAFLIRHESGGAADGSASAAADVDLMEICNYEAGSVAPYHLINVALNLQGTQTMSVRDRASDFFIFSKRFIGGELTGYCRSEHMERVFPQMDLGTAMAISAGAASPNMGRATNPLLVGIMTLLNVRMGFWLPNPGQLEDWLAVLGGNEPANDAGNGIAFDAVFREELRDLQARWKQLEAGADRQLAPGLDEPSLEHRLAGLAFSGGGIRSATINLGLAQTLHHAGVFDHFDYLSTVSGGGYLGSSISASMRRRTPHAPATASASEPRADSALEAEDESSIGEIFRWRVRPIALLREILGMLDEETRWVNVSDGGHIENLAAIELLRRRCRYVLIGDGEEDSKHEFQGLATLIRTARIDLSVDIEIDVDPIRLGDDGQCQRHWAIGRIRYPEDDEASGILIYVKSSVTGDEDVVIRQYRDANPSFPHQSTADQSFNEGQFEAYRSLGQHIGEDLLETFEEQHEAEAGPTPSGAERMPFRDFEALFETLHTHYGPPPGKKRFGAV